MKVRFWGTRGSLATPGRGTTHFGGNTSCVDVTTDSGVRFVLDCGTGARLLGNDLLANAPKPITAHVLLGHTHWDHIQGFPFFVPIFMPGNDFTVYGPSGSKGSLQETLSGQMEYRYFPVELGQLPAKISFNELAEGVYDIGGVQVRTHYLHHPAPTLGYRIDADGASVAYITDHEPFCDSLWRAGAEPGRIESILHDGDRLHAQFMADADLVIHDAQYTPDEYLTKKSWGHSTYDYVVEVAAAARVRKLALTHHDPSHDDVFIADIEHKARAIASQRGSSMEVFCACEGSEVLVRGLRPSQPTPRDLEAVRAPAHAGVRILVADDDELLRKLAVKVLGKLGHTMSEAEDGTSALAALDREMFDLLVLDVEMPEMNGIEVLRALRAKPTTANLPVLMLTALSNEASTREGFEAGATDYLTKPFSIPQLTARVHACIARAAQKGD